MITQLSTIETGSNNSSSIVFLHGGGAGGWMWEPQLAALSDEFHCLAPDLPGQGNSAAFGRFTNETAADAVADLIKSRCHNGHAVVVGLSEGAQVTVSLLAKDAHLVEKAVVSSALMRPIAGSGMYSRGALALTYRWGMAPFKRWDAYIRLNMEYSAGIPERYFAEFKKCFIDMTEEGMTDILYAGMHNSMPTGLEQVTVPVLVVCGSKEYPLMKESARELRSVLPNARQVEVSLGDGANLAKEHNWSMNAPDLFTRMVRAWIHGDGLPTELTQM